MGDYRDLFDVEGEVIVMRRVGKHVWNRCVQPLTPFSFSSSGSRVRRQDFVVAALIFLFSLTIFVRTLAPDLLLGDSGEFQFLARHLGLAHNPGYPIYLLAAKCATLLPIRTIAYRVNLFSALAAAIVLAEVYLIAFLLINNRLYATFGALVLAINRVFWWQAIVAEVYTVAAMTTASVLLFLLLWRQSCRLRYLFVSGLVGGLSLGVHHLVGFMVPAIILYLFLCRASQKAWLAASAGALSGLAFSVASFFFVDVQNTSTGFIQLMRVTASAFGMAPQDFDAPLVRVWFLFSSKEWQSEMFANVHDVLNNIRLCFLLILHNFGLGISTLASVGLAALLLRRPTVMKTAWREGLLLFLSWLGMTFFLINYHVGKEVEVLYIPTYVVLAVLFSIGTAELEDGFNILLRIQLATKLKVNLAQCRWNSPKAYVVILCLFAVSTRIPSAIESVRDGRISFLRGTRSQFPFPVNDPYYARKEVTKLMGMVEDNAIVLIGWDLLYSAYTVSHDDQHRQHLVFIEPTPFGSGGKVPDSLKDYLRNNVNMRPIYSVRILADLLEEFGFKQVDGPLLLYRLESR